MTDAYNWFKKSYYCEDDRAWYLLDSEKQYHKFTNITIKKGTVIPKKLLENLESRYNVAVVNLSTVILFGISDEGNSFKNFMQNRPANELKDIVEAFVGPCEDLINFDLLYEAINTNESQGNVDY